MTAIDRPSAVKFQGTARVHIALEVADLVRAIAFYRVLFGEEPVKLRPGYAKFEPTEPSLNLSLNQGAGGRAGRTSEHFGVQLQSTAAVDALAARFEAAGIAVRTERETACCYSVQDKAWVADPDGNPWEVFVVVEAESDRRSPADSACCAPVTGGTVQASSCCGE